MKPQTVDPGRADSWSHLLDVARDAARFAYCPYSTFRVGAAVSAEDAVFAGCNVENASYGLTVCAERAAIFAAVSGGRRRIDALAVSCPDAAPSAPPSARMPCGACLQVLAEFGGPQTLLVIDGVGEVTLADLLPRPFTLKS